MNRLLPVITLCCAGAAVTGAPTLGGPMSHLLVSVFDQRVYVGFESPSLSAVDMQAGSGFDGPASALNGTGYNGQYGWMANGFIALPPGSGVFVRITGGSPWLSAYSQSGFEPILGTGGSEPLWRWDGAMTHNWYATHVRGTHRLRHEVFVGDQWGNPLSGWIPGVIDLTFHHGDTRPFLPAHDPFLAGVPSLPAPGVPALAIAGLIAWGCRRGG